MTGKARLVGSTARRCRGGPMASVVNSPEDMDSLEKEDLSLPDDYRPSPDEEFMNERQLEYFRQLLLNWKKKILRSEEHTSELQSLMRISYAVFCLKKKNKK